MSPEEKYALKLEADGNQLLREYLKFLSVYSARISCDNHTSFITEYNKIDLNWQKRLLNHKVVFMKFNNNQFAYDEILLLNCQIKIKIITDSLDRIRSELHDELCSLNKKNNLLGLKYNRFQTNGLDPVYIDIKT